MRISSRLIINIDIDDDETLDICLNDEEWQAMVDGVISLGGMIYIEPPKFNGVHVCSNITKTALRHMLLEREYMVIIL